MISTKSGEWFEVKSRSTFLGREATQVALHFGKVEVRIPWPTEALPEGGARAALPVRAGVLERGSAPDVYFIAFANGSRVELPARFEARLPA